MNVPEDELNALKDVWLKTETVNWEAYNRLKARVLHLVDAKHMKEMKLIQAALEDCKEMNTPTQWAKMYVTDYQTYIEYGHYSNGLRQTAIGTRRYYFTERDTVSFTVTTRTI